ncbi:protein of unknown function [Nonlabens sp. Hel1_33_55]|uniref:DUF5123 domain-containing protein n=1 Tax=Nonlabens sp. Hel1_33_55 TaxID=1336802 RepID=UPI000875CD0E|nr:DUF4957 domain-containing protein [Nonlabens sp. Hel1_33_55]SCY41715.1 protein of unknown function [Nonlabens sp. Hel1_33_55]
MINKATKVFRVVLGAVLFLLVTTNCTEDEDLITELDVSREFAPVNVRAQIRTQTTVELTWNPDENVNNYLVEISEDPDFATLVESIETTANELPVRILLAAETLYYVRVQAISSRGINNSNFSTAVIAQTLTEQIFLPSQDGDIMSNQALLRWVPGSTVTTIILNRGSTDAITRQITPQEVIDGMATITGLTGETDYTATLLNGNNIRGIQNFTTEVDRNTGNVITPADDLLQRIADANPGDILLLEAGDYTSQTGTVVLDKPLTIRGLLSYDKPMLRVSFSIVTGGTDINLIDLDLSGDVATELIDTIRYSGADAFDSLVVDGCNVHDYNRSFIAGNESGAVLQSLTVNNCIVTDVITTGGDFIDFRNSDVFNTSVTNSTFNNCAPGRDFFRIDDAGDTTQTGITINVLLENCTLYAVCNNSSRRVLYVRYQMNDIIVRNNLITDTEGYYSNQSRTDENIEFSNNNYFNAPGFFDPTNPRFDGSTTFFNLDPAYQDAENGNFSVSNQTIIDNNIGDPRWLR